MFGFTIIKTRDYDYLCKNTDELLKLRETIRLGTLASVARDAVRITHFDKLNELNKLLDEQKITYAEYRKSFDDECIRFDLEIKNINEKSRMMQS